MHRFKVDPGVSELPWGNELSEDHVNRTQKLPQDKSSLLHVLIINVWNKFPNKKFWKAPEIGNRV